MANSGISVSDIYGTFGRAKNAVSQANDAMANAVTASNESVPVDATPSVSWVGIIILLVAIRVVSEINR